MGRKLKTTCSNEPDENVHAANSTQTAKERASNTFTLRTAIKSTTSCAAIAIPGCGIQGPSRSSFRRNWLAWDRTRLDLNSKSSSMRVLVELLPGHLRALKARAACSPFSPTAQGILLGFIGILTPLIILT